MDLREEELLGEPTDSHWYYRSKVAALLRLLADEPPRSILDVGAGSGFFSRELLTRTSAEEATCIDTGYTRDRDEEVRGKPLRFRRTCETASADVLLLMDVLEHVRDDLGLLSEYVGRMPAGSRVVVTVPAFPFLWSAHDVFLGHERRYRLAEVETLVRSAGLEIVVGSYYFGAVFPIAATMRLAGRLLPARTARSDLSAQPALVNAVLAAACRLELSLFTRNRLAGLTVCCLARVPRPR